MARANETINSLQLVRWFLEIITQIGLFERACEEWDTKLQTSRTFPNFKSFFTTAEKPRSKRTAKETGYANAITKDTIKEEVKNCLHFKLISLLCAEQAHQAQQYFPPIPDAAVSEDVKPPTLPDPPIKQEDIQPEANQTITTQVVKRMIEDALKDAPAHNMSHTWYLL